MSPLAVVGMVLSGLAFAPAADADVDSHPATVDERPSPAAIHVADGEVVSVAQVRDRVVIGGSFSTVGPVTRGAVGLVDVAGKTFGASFPDVAGLVSAVASDGAGGWYLGGEFTSVGGAPRTNLAHVLADGQVGPFAPQPNGPVDALITLPSGGVVAGGRFTEIAGSSAARLVRLTEAGAVEWAGDVNGPVHALAASVDGSTVYLGGGFLKVGGTDRKRLASVSAADGALNTVFVPGTVNNTVSDLVVLPSGVLATGQFTSVAGTSRQRLALVDPDDGTLEPLSIPINGLVRDIVVDQAGTTAYLVGDFTSVAGQSRPKLAGVNLSTGAAAPVRVSTVDGALTSVALDGTSGLFIGGPMQITPEKDNPGMLARVALSSSAVTAVVPYVQTPRSLARPPVSGTTGVNVLVAAGSSLLVAGDFSDYGVTGRRNLAAYSLETGALLPDFDPAPDAAVNSVKASADGSALFVGGDFGSIAGESRARIAKLDAVTGAVVPGFVASADAYVKDMAVRADERAVYVGGAFTTVNGEPAAKLVALNPRTGERLDGFDIPLTEPTNDFSEGGVRALALSPDGTRLMVIGNFRRAAGLDRPLMAQVDVAQPTATVTDWRTDLYDQPCARSGKIGFMRDVDIAPDGETAYVVSAGHFYYPACDSVNAFSMEPDSDIAPLWTKKIGDTLESVAASTDAVYIGGHFRYLETETKTEKRFQIAALDPATGDGLNWVPNAGGFRGVLTVELEPAGLLAGSDGDAFGGVNHGRTAFWPTPAPGIQASRVPHRPWVLLPGQDVRVDFRVQNTFTDRDVTVTSLTDSRLGDLTAAGCPLPSTLSPGQVFECSATDPVSATAVGEVGATVEAAGTAAGGQIVEDSAGSVVQVLSSAPVLRTRVAAGPGVVAFPGGMVRFGVTVMNLDPERPATLTALVSPQLGDVSAECGLPREIRPNGIATCHVDREISGPVGARPSTTFTATAQYATGALTASASATVTVAPPEAGTSVVMVVADPSAPSGADSRIAGKLDDSFVVSYVDDDTVVAADLDTDASLVVLAPSAVEKRLGTRLAQVSAPVLLTHSRMLDEMGMTAAGENGALDGTAVQVVRDMHPLSAGRTGTQTVSSKVRPLSWGTPTSGAEVVTRLASGQATTFAYRPGEAMATVTATACRVFSNAANPTNFTSAAWTLLNRAAAYASMECGRNMLWTAAGNGSTAYGGSDGRSSLAVGLNQPWGLAIDSQGRIHVADAGNHAVRRINADGSVVTVAGTGVAGFAGDGGPATAARLNAPVRIAFDQADNLFVADSANHRIRKVTPDGTISTVAGIGSAGFAGDGGPATAARLRTPYDVAVAADGTLFIADRDNHRVRRVSPAGTIATVAGTGTSGYNGDDIPATTARLAQPYSVDLGVDGSLFIADFNNERVRVVDTDGVISTFAGTGIAGASGDGGPADQAGLHKPQYVDVLASGDVLISESNNTDVRLVHEGLIDTLAGSRQFGYTGDGGPPLFSTWNRPAATLVDDDGNVWIADRNNRRVRVINAN